MPDFWYIRHSLRSKPRIDTSDLYRPRHQLGYPDREHGLDVTTETLLKLYTDGRVGVHFPYPVNDILDLLSDNQSLASADYPPGDAAMMTQFTQIAAHGGLVCAQFKFSTTDVRFMLGRVSIGKPQLVRGTWMSRPQNAARIAIMKTIRLDPMVTFDSSHPSYNVLRFAKVPTVKTLSKWKSVSADVLQLFRANRI